jgi:hypothetical protein
LGKYLRQNQKRNTKITNKTNKKKKERKKEGALAKSWRKDTKEYLCYKANKKRSKCEGQR